MLPSRFIQGKILTRTRALSILSDEEMAYLQQLERSALDEERRAQKALILLKARDHKIAVLEKKIAQLEMANGGHFVSTSTIPEAAISDSSFGSSGRSTHYLSLPPSETSYSQRQEDEIVSRKDDHSEKLIGPRETIKIAENGSVPKLKLPTTSISNSEREAVILKGVNADFNENSSFASDEFRHDESTVDFVVTAALAFAKFDDEQLEGDRCGKVCGDRQDLKGTEDKKQGISRSRKKIVPARMSVSLPWIKTRRRSTMKHLKRGMEKRTEKLRESNELSRNLREVQAGLDALLHKTTKITQTEPLDLEKQKVEDKVVQPDAQEADSTPDPIPHFEQKCASTKTHMHLNYQLYDPTIIGNATNHVMSSQSHSLGHQESSIILSDEPAPQWLIEEALKRGKKFSKNNLSVNADGDNDEDNIASNFRSERIICELEKKLCATREELADALNEQLCIKNKYKKALRNVKIAADEERDEMQRKLVKICTCIFEKFGPDALTDNRVKQRHKKYQKPLQHFGKLSRKLHRKLRLATLTSTKLKQEVQSTKKDLDEKAKQYDSLLTRFENLNLELKNAEINMKELRNENIALRKEIDDTREWKQIRVSKERNEKINAAQFRDIQRSRELANLKKKSEEDLSTISQLRSKLLRLESANSNRGVLLSSYKIQLAEITEDNNKLSSKIKELENENSLLRSNNAQLKTTIALLNNEKEKKIDTVSEKSEIVEREKNHDIMEKMQSKLATKYERSMLQKIETMRAKYDKIIQAMESKLIDSENVAAQYFGAIKRFFKQIHEYYRELNAERDLSCSEASEREAHETACTILNITPGELTGILKGHPSKTINSWLSELQKITSRKTFAEDLAKLLFDKAIGSTEN